MPYEIVDVGTSKTLTDKLAMYARNCSFQGSGSYLADLLLDNAFIGYEKVFSVIDHDKMIGFAAILHECFCIEGENNSPWLDFLFVDEEYRNQHVGIALIERICGYAKSIGFSNIYLCTASHVDYYSKIGFHTLYSTTHFNNVNNENNIHVMKRVLDQYGKA